MRIEQLGPPDAHHSTGLILHWRQRLLFALEPVHLPSIADAALPIAYSGFLSVGIAYTLQVVAQKKANPSHAAIIMSLETVAAALGGWIVLGESMSARALAGCALMLAGMLISRLTGRAQPD